MDKPQIICHVEKSLNYTLFDCKWIPKTAKFIVVGSQPRGTGTIELFEICSTDVRSISKIETGASLKCATFGVSPVGRKLLACGDFNGNLELWDLDTSKKTYEVKAHEEIINCIDALGGTSTKIGPPEVVTGSRDGTVKVWDVRQKEKPVVIIKPEDGEQKRDCWSVAFGNSYDNYERVVCCGYDNGDIRLFDLRQSCVRWSKNLKNGICSIEFDRKDIPMNKLLATTLESKFHVYDCRTLHPTQGFADLTEKAHKSTIWMGRHLPQNRDIFMTTGGNGAVCLWKYNYPDCRVKKEVDSGLDVGVIGNVDLLQNMTLASQPLSSFDWCPDKLGLAICTGFDQCLRLVIVTKLNQF
ncbi:WD repeat-containing protein 92 [Orchesella cincta]|uniref:WD repeat-containing protein 92 n=1 Tax=Orchesella cincta TaxID=48709 RepID=A0A1D2MPF9_ORCCI|nr:WD repeat-containing protein 92 [Orchesella cincta]